MQTEEVETTTGEAEEAGEAGTPTKTPKVSAAQEQPSTPAPYPDWSAAFQAYYNAGGTPPPGYFPPAGGPHPYMWGGQMMPPYGTPPYGAIYPHGVYGHPSMQPGPHLYSQYGMQSPGSGNEAAGTVPTAADADAKSSEGKERKRSKENLGLKGNEPGKVNSVSGNGVVSQSGESQSGESGSEGSEEDNAHRNALEPATSMEGGISVTQPYMHGAFGTNGMLSAPSPGSQPIPPGGAKLGPPVGYINMGMEYWGGGMGTAQPSKGKRNSASSQALVPSMPNTQLMAVPGRDAVHPELWLQDERELKRQRRKQSNRESARRSRLRKQAECEELSQRVDSLTVENMALRTELNRLVEERNKLSSDNSSLIEQLHKARVEAGLEGEEICSTHPEENGGYSGISIRSSGMGMRSENDASHLDAHTDAVTTN